MARWEISLHYLDQWVPVNCFNQLITHARCQDLVSGPRYLALRTWISGPQCEVSGPGSQDLGFRPSTRGFRTWLSGPGFQALGIWLSAPGFQALDIWLSGPGFQDLNARFQDLDLRTWVSGPRYLALRTWVSGPRKLSILRSSYLFPVTFLCVHRHFSFSRHFPLRPPSLFSASSGHRRTDARTDATSDFIYKISTEFVRSTQPQPNHT